MFGKNYLNNGLENDLKKANELLRKITEKVEKEKTQFTDKDGKLINGKNNIFIEGKDVIINAAKLFQEIGKKRLFVSNMTTGKSNKKVKVEYENDVNTIVDLASGLNEKLFKIL